jgi:hypothetical protein
MPNTAGWKPALPIGVPAARWMFGGTCDLTARGI